MRRVSHRYEVGMLGRWNIRWCTKQLTCWQLTAYASTTKYGGRNSLPLPIAIDLLINHPDNLIRPLSPHAPLLNRVDEMLNPFALHYSVTSSPIPSKLNTGLPYIHLATFATWRIKGVVNAVRWRQFPALQWCQPLFRERELGTPPFALGLCWYNYTNIQRRIVRQAASSPRHIVSRLADHPHKGHHLQTHSPRLARASRMSLMISGQSMSVPSTYTRNPTPSQKDTRCRSRRNGAGPP